MSKSRSADSAVYKRPLSGGEAIDDDVEGHSMMTHASGGPKLHAAGGPKLHAAGGRNCMPVPSALQQATTTTSKATA